MVAKKWKRLRMSRHGFSLLELLVVLSIIMVIAAAVIPVFSGAYANLQRDHALRDIVAMMKYAQERAITDAIEYRVYFHEESGRFWIMRLARMDADAKVFAMLDEPWGTPQSLPAKAKFSRLSAERDRDQDARYIAFYPSGACAYATIRIIDEDRNRIEIATKGNLSQFKVKRSDD
jgi:prepilin-type N-terminal cleavage/methylation domain-containing protein